MSTTTNQEKKELDFWTLLHMINDYDTWLRDNLCSLQAAGTEDIETKYRYRYLKECRVKLQQILSEV
jgi:hypothetical protein